MSIHSQIEAIDRNIAQLNKERKELVKILNSKHEDEEVNKYLNTYSGQRLLKEHSLTEEGIWDVFGEDPNCDFGGSHHTPYLQTFEGKLENVLKVAVRLPNFWSWGGGGSIRKKVEPKITKV